MPATLDSSDVLALSSRAHLMSSADELVSVGSGADVGGDALVDGIADLSLQCAQRFLAGLAFVLDDVLKQRTN